MDENIKTLDYATGQLLTAVNLPSTPAQLVGNATELPDNVTRKHVLDRDNMKTKTTTTQSHFPGGGDLMNMVERLSEFSQQQGKMYDSEQFHIAKTLTTHKDRVESLATQLGELACSVAEARDCVDDLGGKQLTDDTTSTKEKPPCMNEPRCCHQQMQPTLRSMEQQLSHSTQRIAELSIYVKQQVWMRQVLTLQHIQCQFEGLLSIEKAVEAYSRHQETSITLLQEKVMEIEEANRRLIPPMTSLNCEEQLIAEHQTGD
ncbi:PREDICTED: uncharacterized protein LOC106809565 [Priapulus caudatus]|uniref:Uncharacterized protein LOC106809565 n=1 Tax=Priapulus caudatus TaxID=37621 RepID=A0ABM1E7K2_PRICU|nr:PREDICTED: uncharacterized protein LOC106809565 [Priapulus caudatus]